MQCSWTLTAWQEGHAVKKEGESAFSLDAGQEREAVNLYPELVYQTFEGFGGALTEAAAYNYSQMPPEVQKEFLQAYFGLQGLGYTQARMSLDSCDAGLGNYSAV